MLVFQLAVFVPKVSKKDGWKPEDGYAGTIARFKVAQRSTYWLLMSFWITWNCVAKSPVVAAV
jgi:hypothetical protein